MNKHREICTFQLTGSMLLNREQVLRCSNISVVKVTEITELIQKALANDSEARKRGEKFGFAVSVEKQKIMATEKTCAAVDMSDVEEQAAAAMAAEGFQEDDDMEDVVEKVRILGKGTAAIGMGGES